ncbi:PREDICTED: uncharacterized protein LOC105460516, partial [Wasmannia auropunctata]|uniref:uncharacterized protein LOC105460516 n=1 Tax=Wasmannia auropunctata TaxID=64793 RepID=UPI0005EE47CC
MDRFNANCNTSIDKQTFNTADHCTCCPKRKNYNETFRKIFKELFLLREFTKECCEDVKVTFLQKCNAATIDGGEPTFLSTFHFPLQSVEDLNEVEQYLEQPNRFQSTVKEFSKMGGTTPYDFVKRCLSLLLSNRLAEQYSWHGAKKKQIFGKLSLANVLQESALQCK